MFLHDTHLPQLLPSSAYTSQDQLEREIEVLFKPAWHFIGSFSQIPHDGDFLTTSILNYPLIIWRNEGTYQAYLNVCPHRFAQLTCAPKGHCQPHLKCQYHGWEFDSEGNTRQIPDARSFRPLSKGALTLKKFRTETIGQLIFINFNEDAPSLKEWLGPEASSLMEKLFPPEYPLLLAMDFEIEANWKCRMENAVESYHLDMVHPKTLGKIPPAEDVIHRLHPEWSVYEIERTLAKNRIEEQLDRLMHRLAGKEMDLSFRNHFRYPHIMFTSLRMFRSMEWLIPVSPTRTRMIYQFFCFENPHSWRSRLARRLISVWAKPWYRQVVREDATSVERVQKGLNSPQLPSAGVISAREERCFHFQEYIQEMTRPAAPRTSPEGNCSNGTLQRPAESECSHENQPC